MIMEMVGNRSFALTTGNGQRSMLRRLKNGVPEGSDLALLLFNIYISDLLNTISRKYSYADDLAIMHADGDWQAVEGALSKDMATLGEYLHTWKLKLSTTKTVSAVFHLNNKEAKCELKVNFNSETLPFCSEPKYLGVTLDRSLTYRPVATGGAFGGSAPSIFFVPPQMIQTRKTNKFCKYSFSICFNCYVNSQHHHTLHKKPNLIVTKSIVLRNVHGNNFAL